MTPWVPIAADRPRSVADLLASLPDGRGTLYFEAGTHEIVGPAATFPAFVDLRFAPDARLRTTTQITIRGCLRAGVAQVFSTQATTPVFLAGERNPVIDLRWWGVSDDPFETADALRHLSVAVSSLSRCTVLLPPGIIEADFNRRGALVFGPGVQVVGRGTVLHLRNPGAVPGIGAVALRLAPARRLPLVIRGLELHGSGTDLLVRVTGAGHAIIERCSLSTRSGVSLAIAGEVHVDFARSSTQGAATAFVVTAGTLRVNDATGGPDATEFVPACAEMRGKDTRLRMLDSALRGRVRASAANVHAELHGSSVGNVEVHGHRACARVAGTRISGWVQINAGDVAVQRGTVETVDRTIGTGVLVGSGARHARFSDCRLRGNSDANAVLIDDAPTIGSLRVTLSHVRYHGYSSGMTIGARALLSTRRLWAVNPRVDTTFVGRDVGLRSQTPVALSTLLTPIPPRIALALDDGADGLLLPVSAYVDKDHASVAAYDGAAPTGGRGQFSLRPDARPPTSALVGDQFTWIRSTAPPLVCVRQGTGDEPPAEWSPMS